MPLDQIDTTAKTVTSLCSNCGLELVSDLNKLELGTMDSADIIVLPACSCGSQEYLFRTWDAKVDAPHRRAVNGLAEHLKSKGQSNKNQRKVHAREKGAPPLCTDVSAGKIDDLTGRRASAEMAKRAAEDKARREVEAPAREAAAVAAAEKAAKDAEEAERAQEERLFQLASSMRAARAAASVNKRLGLPPGSEPPADELEAELQKPAGEFLSA